MEANLSYSRSNKARDFDKERDALIEELFANNTVLVTKLRDERWSPEKLLPIIERLHQRLRRAMGKSPSRSANVGFQIGDTRSAAGEEDEEERIRLTFHLTDLLAAAQTLDELTARGENPNTRWNGRVATMFESKLRELQQGTEVKVGIGNNDAIKGYVQQSLRPDETPAFLVETPRWLPPTFAFYLGDPNWPVKGKVDQADIAVIRNDVLAGSKFYCSSVESNALACFFRGSLRNMKENSPENYTSVAFKDIEDRLEQTGISERVQIFFIPDTSRFVGGQDIAILAVPKAMVPTTSKGYPLTLSILACVGAAATTAAYAVSCFALNPKFFDAIMNQPDVSPRTLLTCAPIFLGVLGIQAVHELAHRAMAKRRKVKLGLPVPLLSPELGTFGAMTPYRSFPPNLDALFDISVSGPLSGMVASVGCMIAGTIATLNSSAGILSTFPVVPIALFKGSFLMGSILSVLAPKLMLLPIAQPIPVHPAICIGFVGLLTNALNMLPILGLDGGSALAAIVGRGRAFLATAATILTLTLSFLQGNDSSLFPSFGIIFAVSRIGKKPLLVRNEITPVNDTRVAIYFVAFTLALLALIPFPGGRGFL